MTILSILQERTREQAVVEKIMQGCSFRSIDLFQVNSLAANLNKYQVMIIDKMTNPINHIMIDNTKVKATTITLLGLEIGNTLSFKQHVDLPCQKENFKTNALQRIRSYLDMLDAWI